MGGKAPLSSSRPHVHDASNSSAAASRLPRSCPHRRDRERSGTPSGNAAPRCGRSHRESDLSRMRCLGSQHSPPPPHPRCPKLRRVTRPASCKDWEALRSGPPQPPFLPELTWRLWGRGAELLRALPLSPGSQQSSARRRSALYVERYCFYLALISESDPENPISCPKMMLCCGHLSPGPPAVGTPGALTRPTVSAAPNLDFSVVSNLGISLP